MWWTNSFICKQKSRYRVICWLAYISIEESLLSLIQINMFFSHDIDQALFVYGTPHNNNTFFYKWPAGHLCVLTAYETNPITVHPLTYRGQSCTNNSQKHWYLGAGLTYGMSVVSSHYDDVIMTMLASQITSLQVVYSIVYSGVNQRKHQSSASLAIVRGIHRGPVNFPHKWPVTRKMFRFEDVIMRVQ